ncbi:hypothetical protein PPL_10201 [Heterostelium album PN500]|uniref:Terpene synthase n=1 Tax=Heterostelium pallidum (strain ATCC 26659 / Pp 5 / PN500) TaxID=670386 RepID=D3BQL6_HETP5|nr:hypothetical protein PPL_10201 [Heterostelium album PN500]EFA76436.1 hypothetical protein PPL_10201 [Heterostelium album PN500]|eukprot:XP_020428568.1 hypothetical protein PPL_10201 [Heterostelium album PN500]
MNPYDPMEIVTQKIERFGILNDENREKNRPMFKGISMFVRSIWPSADQESIVLGTQFFIFSRIFDDLIDSNEPEFGIKLINRAINIFTLGKLEDDPKPYEKNIFDLVQNLQLRVGDQHPLMNLFRIAFLDCFDNLIPWQNMKKLNGDMSMNLYYILRRHNIGTAPTVFLGLMFIVKRLNYEIFLDPLLKCLWDQGGRISALYNDVLSYEKEVRENDVRMNSFHFMKTQNNWSDQECLEFFEKEMDKCFEQYFIHENLIIQKFIPTLQNKEDQEEFYQIIGFFHKLISSLLMMYLKKPNYKSPDSIFVELRN